MYEMSRELLNDVRLKLGNFKEIPERLGIVDKTIVLENCKKSVVKHSKENPI